MMIRTCLVVATATAVWVLTAPVASSAAVDEPTVHTEPPAPTVEPPLDEPPPPPPEFDDVRPDNPPPKWLDLVDLRARAPGARSQARARIHRQRGAGPDSQVPDRLEREFQLRRRGAGNAPRQGARPRRAIQGQRPQRAIASPGRGGPCAPCCCCDQGEMRGAGPRRDRTVANCTINVSEQDQPRRARGAHRQQGPGLRGRGPQPGGPAPERPGAEMERVRRFVREHFPERMEKMEQFRQRNPDGFRRHMRQMMPRIRRMMETMERDPEAGALMVHEEHLNLDIQRMAREYSQAVDPDRLDALRHEIRARVEERYDVRLKRRDQEIQRLERRLEAIRAQLANDLESREFQIGQELLDLGVVP